MLANEEYVELKHNMSGRRRRRLSERRLARASKRTPITIWSIIIIALVASAIGLVRACR